jgi:hypothetical protein
MPRIIVFTRHISRKIGGGEEFLAGLGRLYPNDILVVENDYEKIPANVRIFLRNNGLQLCEFSSSRRTIMNNWRESSRS